MIVTQTFEVRRPATASGSFLAWVPPLVEQMRARGSAPAARLGEITAADVIRFVQLDAGRLRHPKRAKVMTSALRSFLQYGRYLGDIRADLQASVPTVANWSMAGIPRSISPAQVNGLLSH